MMDTIKQKNRFAYSAVLALLSLTSFLTVVSCTKTETVPYEAEPIARISSFKIVNTATEIPGAINEEEKTITVTIPGGIYVNTLEPEIELAAGSTLKEGADSLITELISYFAEGSTRAITYPVTATDGSTTTYQLRIKTNQPPLVMQEVTVDPANPASYNQTHWYTINLINIYNTVTNYPYSTNHEFDLELAQASLIATDGTEYKFKLAQSGMPPTIPNGSYMLLNLNDIIGRITGSGANAVYTQTPPAGLYKIKLRYYSREVSLNNPIRIFYNN